MDEDHPSGSFLATPSPAGVPSHHRGTPSSSGFSQAAAAAASSSSPPPVAPPSLSSSTSASSSAEAAAVVEQALSSIAEEREHAKAVRKAEASLVEETLCKLRALTPRQEDDWLWERGREELKGAEQGLLSAPGGVTLWGGEGGGGEKRE